MAEMTWAEAVAQLASARTKAETSAAILKKFGDSGHVARGQLIYSDAKAEADAVIAGLIVALSAKGEPESLSSLQERVERAVTGLAQLRKLAESQLPNLEGTKGDLNLTGRHPERRDRAAAQTAVGGGSGSLQPSPDGQ